MIRATRLHRSPHATYLATATAGLVIVMAVAQLFAYETFPEAVASGLRAVSSSLPITLFSAVIVTLEVAAVANLLNVALSQLARVCSMIAGILVPIMWIILMVAKEGGNSGLFGSKLSLPVGLMSYALMLVLLVLTATLAALDLRRRA